MATGPQRSTRGGTRQAAQSFGGKRRRVLPAQRPSPPFYALRELAGCQGSGDVCLFCFVCFSGLKGCPPLLATTVTCLETLPRELRTTKALLELEAELRIRLPRLLPSTRHGRAAHRGDGAPRAP